MTRGSHQETARESGSRVGEAVKIGFSNLHPEADRFWSKVAKSDGCWEWKAGTSPHGYGRYRLPKRAVFAHRYAYEQCVGEIPDGLFVCHRCDNPRCVNPAHLFLGTHEDNMRDMTRKGRSTWGERSGRRKLSADDVAEVHRLRHDGLSLAQIAARFGVTRQNVHLVVSGRTWARAQERG